MDLPCLGEVLLAPEFQRTAEDVGEVDAVVSALVEIGDDVDGTAAGVRGGSVAELVVVPEGDLVVDPFGGSGVTARAARSCNRSAIVTEYNKTNFDLAVEKYRNTGDALLL